LLGILSLGDLLRAPKLLRGASEIDRAANIERAALDANVLIRGIDKGQLAGVDAALAGRSPVVSITAAKQYLKGGDPNALRAFLESRSGSIGKAATAQQIQSLQEQAGLLGRVISASDAAVAGSAVSEGVTLLTNDKQLFRYLQAAGYQVEFWKP
jgi:predicted nucleic acid-binding protein